MVDLFDIECFFKYTIPGAIEDVISDVVDEIEEVVDVMTCDPEVEGKKQGYTRAAKEYKNAYNKVEKEYEETKKILEDQTKAYDAKAKLVLQRYTELYDKRIKLEQDVEKKSKEVSKKYNIPYSTVKHAASSGELLTNQSIGQAVIFLGIYEYKKKKIKEAEQRGYLAAKEEYENRLEVLKKDLKNLRVKGNRDILELKDKIQVGLACIADEEMRIADLKLLLK